MDQITFKLVILLFFVTYVSTGKIDGGIKRSRVLVNYGLQDAEAVIGKIFRYTIPKDAFEGDVDFYEVTEAGGTTLQGWLVWHPERSELVGIPREEDSGPNYVQVTAISFKDKSNHTDTSQFDDASGRKAKDVFSISVRDEFRISAHGIPDDERIRCHQQLTPITMNLLFTIDPNQLTIPEKIKILRKISSKFGIKEGALRLYSSTDESFSSLKRHILVASAPSATPAPAPVPVDKFGFSAETVVMWRVECSSNGSTPENNTALNYLQSVEDSQIFGYQISSWYMAAITHEPKRRRRQASNVTPNSYFGHTGPTWAVDVTVPTIPTTSSTLTSSTSTKTTTTATITTTPATTTTTPVTTSTTISTTPTTPPTQTTTVATTVSTDSVPTRKPGDAKPTLKKSLGTLHCQQNKVCYIPIPSGTFHDPEDGDTSKLHLRLDALSETEKRSSWLQLDHTRQILYGLPFKSDVSLFRLTATDSGNRQAPDTFSVEIKEDPIDEKQLTHRIFVDLTVLESKKNSKNDMKYRIQFLQKLAEYFGDSNAEKIRINKMDDKFGLGLSWSNISLPMDACPKYALDVIMARLTWKDGQVHPRLKKFMDPPFIVRKISIEYGGACVMERAQESIPSTLRPPSSSTLLYLENNGTEILEPTKFPPASSTGDTFFISTILPTIIIAILLIVAALVACILYRKNRQEKKKGRIESKSEFVSKGTPVIFPDEMDMDKESNAMSPMLLKDEKPPLEPLEFTGGMRGEQMIHGNGNGNGNTIALRSPSGKVASLGPGRALGKTQVLEAETELWHRPLLQDTDENPLYRPPPAFEPAGTKESRSPRPKHASPQQREPPPYVPP